MTRRIIIDEDTEFGYYFPKKKFYIKNKNTETLREKPTSAKRVLDIVAPNNNISLEEVIELSEKFETVQEVFYTWQDDGSYIRTIQFNDYNENPLTLDGEKQKLYIMNTNIIYDLTLTEGKRFRLDYIQAYYKNNLGLDIPLTSEDDFNLSDLYDLLIYFYKPHVYNKIEKPKEEPRKERLKYSSTLELADYIRTSPVHYSITGEDIPDTLGEVESMKGNVITLVNERPPYDKGAVIVVEGTTQVIEGEEVSNDDEYIVVSHEGKEITVNKEFAVPYEFKYFTTNEVVASARVEGINTNKTITLTDTVPSNMKAGDKIRLQNAVVVTDYGMINADEDFTIKSVSGKVITVNEEIKYTYTFPTDDQPVVYKEVLLGKVLSWKDTKITLEKEVPSTVKHGTYVTMVTDRRYIFKVVGTRENVITVDANPYPNPYNPNFPKVQEKVMLVNVTESRNEEELPVGEFALDNRTEANTYLDIFPELVLPTEEQYNNMRKYVSDGIMLNVGERELELKMLGLYTELYIPKDTV